MLKLFSILILALTCATLHAQSVIIKGTGAGAVHRSGTGAGSVRVVIYATTNTYSDGRFEIVSDNTDVVLDNYTSKMWNRSATVGIDRDWSNSITFCDGLTTNGYSDWRLPTAAEFFSTDGSDTNALVFGQTAGHQGLPVGHPFLNVPETCWSSTEVDDETATFIKPWGLSAPYYKITEYSVWPCRGP